MTALSRTSLEKDLVAFISTDTRKLYTDTFSSNQGQTTTWALDYVHRMPMSEVWRHFPESRSHAYDQAIIRVYEEIIVELQREVARYREALVEIILNREIEAESDLRLPAEPTRLAPDIAQKMRSKTRPGRRVTESEI